MANGYCTDRDPRFGDGPCKGGKAKRTARAEPAPVTGYTDARIAAASESAVRLTARNCVGTAQWPRRLGHASVATRLAQPFGLKRVRCRYNERSWWLRLVALPSSSRTFPRRRQRSALFGSMVKASTK